MSRQTIYVGSTFTTNEGCTVEVVEYNGCYSVVVRFAEGHTANVSANSLRTGMLKNPMHPSVCDKGYLGIGPHRAYEKCKQTPAYASWVKLMGRTSGQKYHNFQEYANDFYKQTKELPR